MYDDGMGIDFLDPLDTSDHSKESDEPTVPFELPPIEEDIRPMVVILEAHTPSNTPLHISSQHNALFLHILTQQRIGEKMEGRKPGVFALEADESVQALVSFGVFGRRIGWITFTGEQPP